LAQVRRGRVVGRLDRAGSTLPTIMVEAPAEALHRDGRNRHLYSIIHGPREPRLDPAHAEPDHANPAGIDVAACLEIVDRAPDVPARIEVERVLLRLARLRLPRADDRLVVRIGPLGPAGALAVVASVNRDAHHPALRQVLEERFLPLLRPTRPMKHD